ncbi:uncharacterized protein BHQ10_009449 [Talaromyces amestolkiae]|uniref:Uncharacterized protein n=1 Tax=Talaromyces amestolkiae TaxID=1196081 RepID=A0A364LCC1_TALAM|nr:uncharacterized protein BHQ10_009449 [Talaromyces amestolkiae]RAO73437.1 hypothetical protein BHQ10_009449 [Talaromyces amestolkiae]
MTDFLNSLMVDKDVKNSQSRQYILILFWEYSAEDDTHIQDEEEEVEEDKEEDEDFIFAAPSRKRPRAVSKTRDTSHIKTEPLSPSRSTPKPRGPRNSNLRPFWEPTPAPVDTSIEEIEAIIQEGREEEAIFEAEIRAFDQEIRAFNRGGTTESTTSRDRDESVIDIENLAQANIASEDSLDVPAAHTRGKHGIKVPKKQS